MAFGSDRKMENIVFWHLF